MSLDELASAVRDLAMKKAPGINNLPMEFYRRLWNVLGEDHLEVVWELSTSPRLPDSMRRGVVNLMHKGDREDLSNGYPITLLNININFKVRTKVGSHESRQ